MKFKGYKIVDGKCELIYEKINENGHIETFTDLVNICPFINNTDDLYFNTEGEQINEKIEKIKPFKIDGNEIYFSADKDKLQNKELFIEANMTISGVTGVTGATFYKPVKRHNFTEEIKEMNEKLKNIKTEIKNSKYNITKREKKIIRLKKTIVNLTNGIENYKNELEFHELEHDSVLKHIRTLSMF